MSHRQKINKNLILLFGFLQHLPTLSLLEITGNALNLAKAFQEDLKESLREESIQFAQLLNVDEFVKIGSKTLDSSSSSSNLFISKNTKDTRANYSSEYIVILSTNFGIL